MSTPPGTYDTLDALDAATVAPATPLAAAPDAAAGPDASSPIITQLPAVQFNPNSVAIHTGFYVTNDDTITFNAFASVAGLQLAMAYELLRPDGTIARNLVPFTPTGDRLANTYHEPLIEGFLISVNVGALQNGIQQGQAFVDLGIQRPGQIPQVRPIHLCSGYVVSSFDFGWPSNTNRAYTDGQGYMHNVNQANPAAGADFKVTVPVNARWRVNSLTALLSTSAVAGNRFVLLAMDDGFTDSYAVQTTASQPASTVYRYTFAEGLPLLVTGVTNVTAPLPNNNRLLAGWDLFTITNGLLAGDQWSAITLAVEEWIEP
jgi:hypothetical protein